MKHNFLKLFFGIKLLFFGGLCVFFGCGSLQADPINIFVAFSSRKFDDTYGGLVTIGVAQAINDRQVCVLDYASFYNLYMFATMPHAIRGLSENKNEVIQSVKNAFELLSNTESYSVYSYQDTSFLFVPREVMKKNNNDLTKLGFASDLKEVDLTDIKNQFLEEDPENIKYDRIESFKQLFDLSKNIFPSSDQVTRRFFIIGQGFASTNQDAGFIAGLSLNEYKELLNYFSDTLRVDFVLIAMS